MDNHPIIVTLKNDGTTSIIYHPATQVGIADRLSDCLGEISGDHRGGHCYPAWWVARVAFQAMRRLFGNTGIVAEWTRHWDCPWVVVRADNGEPLPGMYRSHGAAVNAEVVFMLREKV